MSCIQNASVPKNPTPAIEEKTSCTQAESTFKAISKATSDTIRQSHFNVFQRRLLSCLLFDTAVLLNSYEERCCEGSHSEAREHDARDWISQPTRYLATEKEEHCEKPNESINDRSHTATGAFRNGPDL